MAKKKQSSSPPVKEHILTTALQHAEKKGWDNVRLYQIAEELNITLDEIYMHYADMNAVANAWFSHALHEMSVSKTDDFSAQPPVDRLHSSLSQWFDYLSTHQTVTIQMIRIKMHPPHIHHWVPMIFDLSRLIHCWLDSAHISSVGRERQMAEVGLTLIFLRTLARWSRDKSPNQKRTKSFLKKRLHRAERCLVTCRTCC